ncbi:putative transcription factor interactor and regulator CCHC(Zn) family [Helianthus anomalus]
MGYKKKNNQKKSFKKSNFQKKMNFVHGTSSEKEKEIQFSRQTNEEFYARKKQQQQAKDVSKNTCFKCKQVGHIGHKCPKNLKLVYVEKKKSGVGTKAPKFEPKHIWKQKDELSKRSIQNDSRFYIKNVSNGQTWVVKQKVTSDSDGEKTKLDSTKKVELKKKENVFL